MPSTGIHQRPPLLFLTSCSSLEGTTMAPFPFTSASGAMLLLPA